MNASQRRKKRLIDELLEHCNARGLGPGFFAPHVQKSASLAGRDRDLRLGHEVNSAGLTAQLNYLLEVWGHRRLKKLVMKSGGVLDAIVRSTSHTGEQLEQQLGRDNVDENGDPL